MEYVEIELQNAARAQYLGFNVVLQLEAWTGKTTAWTFDNVRAGFPGLEFATLPQAIVWAQSQAAQLFPYGQTVLRARWNVYIPADELRRYECHFVTYMSAGVSILA